MLKKSNNNLTQQVVDELLERILGIHPGDCLGTEANLTEEFNVSRNILREAVNRLKGLGILESRQNQGLVVRKPDMIDIFETVLPFYAVNDLSFKELFDLRYCLETGAVGLAVERATEEQLKDLEDCAMDYVQKLKPGIAKDELTEIEVKFHTKLLNAANNKFISSMYAVIIKYFQEAPGYFESWPNLPEEECWKHLLLARAMARRDRQTACALIRDLFYNSIVKQKEQKKKKEEQP